MPNQHIQPIREPQKELLRQPNEEINQETKQPIRNRSRSNERENQPKATETIKIYNVEEKIPTKDVLKIFSPIKLKVLTEIVTGDTKLLVCEL